MIEIDPKHDIAYTYTPDVVLPVAESLGVELSPHALRQQRLMTRAIGFIDTTLDDPETGRETRPILEQYCRDWRDGSADQAPEQLHPELIAIMQELREGLTPMQARHVVELGFKVLKLMDGYRSTTSLKDYIEARRQEGRLAAAMMLIVTPEAEQKQPNFKRYATLVTLILGGTNILDSLTDFRKDRKQREISLRFNPYNMVGMAGYAAVSLWTGRKKLGKELLGTVLRNGIAVTKGNVPSSA